MELKKKTPWKSQRDGFQDSLAYMQGRRTGKISSLRTPWPKFNDAGTDGLEWHSTTVIGGRPASGKTLIKDQIVREAFTRNKGDDFRVLEFQLEMLARTNALREYTSVIGKSYKYLCSAEGRLTDEDLNTCYEYAKAKVKQPIDIIEDPCTVSEFKLIIAQYMETHAIHGTAKEVYDDDGETKEREVSTKTYRKTIITIDHCGLLKKDSFEKDKFEMLYNLGEALTFLKRKYPIAFIVLSQLNRNIDHPDRAEDGKYGNYVLESDIYGADALLQHADMLIGINRPAKQKIRFYGPDRFIIKDDTVLAIHFLKCRNGDTRVSFFEAKFKTMQIVEMPTPGTQDKRIKTT